MQSTSLLPVLRQLPTETSRRHKSHRELITDLASRDRALHAAEAAAAASFALWGVFPGVNVDDRLLEAYELAYPGLAAEHSLYEHYLRVTESGEASITGFISGLKGKLAELHAEELLEQNGYTNVEIADSVTQPVWDISAISPSGEPVLFQVKTGAESYADEVADAMESRPDVNFMIGSEIYEEISASLIENTYQFSDIGSDDILVEDINGGLSVLSENLGIDVPDSVGDILPVLGGMLIAVRLIYGAVRTEQTFREADRTFKNKCHVVLTLTLMSRFGINTVLTTAVASGGTVMVPGPGTLGGLAIGLAASHYLNKHLQPSMLDLALNITGLTTDDLFYYKNKPRIDEVAVRFHETARRLAA